MKRTIVFISLLLSAYISIMAQHPRVCDYVSLKHALKGREYEVITAEHTKNGGSKMLVHTKDMIRIPKIEEFGKDIDSLDIINYKNDTIYIYREVCVVGYNETIEFKSNKGAYRVYEDNEKTFEQFEIEDNDDEEWNCDPNYFPSIYPDLFKWNGIEKLLKERDMAMGSEVFEELYRFIFKDYRLVHVDKWFFRPLFIPFKRIHKIHELAGIKTDIPLETPLVHVYDTISKKDNDEYISIMYKEENIPPKWIKKGSWIIRIGDHDEKKNYILYEGPDTRSREVYKFKEEHLTIYDIVGLWYYVKPRNVEGICGWIKLDDTPKSLYPLFE